MLLEALISKNLINELIQSGIKVVQLTLFTLQIPANDLPGALVERDDCLEPRDEPLYLAIVKNNGMGFIT